MNAINTATSKLTAAINGIYGEGVIAELTPFMVPMQIPEELVYTQEDLDAAAKWVEVGKEIYPELADAFGSAMAFQAVPQFSAEISAVAALAGGVLGYLSAVDAERFKAFFDCMDAYRSAHPEIIAITEKGEQIKGHISPVFFSTDGAFAKFCEIISRNPALAA